MSIVTIQSYLLSVLDGLQFPASYNIPPADAYITPPDPRVKARVPAIYIWPSDGTESRAADLGGTIPRNTGPGTASGTKGLLHQFDIYVTWFSAGTGTTQDPKFPAVVDAVLQALRTATPDPDGTTDPATGLTSTIYNVGEKMRYRIGVEATANQREKRYDSLISCSIWEIIRA